MGLVNDPNGLYTCISRSLTLEGVFLLRAITVDDIDYATQGVNQFAPELARLCGLTLE